jgi:hypothetical protein
MVDSSLKAKAKELFAKTSAAPQPMIPFWLYFKIVV